MDNVYEIVRTGNKGTVSVGFSNMSEVQLEKQKNKMIGKS